MDGDDFSRATRPGRMAAEAIWETVANDAPFDGFATGELIDRFIAHAGGIPSLPGILAILADLASQPLSLPLCRPSLSALSNPAPGQGGGP